MTFGSMQCKSIFKLIQTSFALFFFVAAFQTIVSSVEAALLPNDDFNDNAIGDIWYLIEDDPTKVWLDETNQRLEGRSTGETDEGEALYVSKQWQLSTDHDFSMQINWHYSNISPTAGLFFGIVSDLSAETFVNLNVARDEGVPNFYLDAAEDGDEFYDSDKMPRAVMDGVFFVSYDSANDRFYLSINGYRRSEDTANGDWVFENLLKGSWKLDAVNVDIGFYDEDSGIETASGNAYFDNFEVIQGVLEGALDGDNIMLYDSVDSAFYLKNSLSGGSADTKFNFGPSNAGWNIITGDWNGNGQTTVGLYNPDQSKFYLKNSHSGGAADIKFVFGPAFMNWIPVTGDWNGNGQCGIGLYNPVDGTFRLKNANNGGTADEKFRFGPSNAGWQPISGDWDGDGVDTIGLYSPKNGTFYLKNTFSGGSADVKVGFGPRGTNWKPVCGDWDADGITEIGLFNPITSSFYFKNTHSGGTADIKFGFGPAGSGWIPLSGNWE